MIGKDALRLSQKVTSLVEAFFCHNLSHDSVLDTQ